MKSTRTKRSATKRGANTLPTSVWRTLEERFAEVPRDRPVGVVCGSGYRASIAASFLQREGYRDVTNILGGMTAWKAAELPTVQE